MSVSPLTASPFEDHVTFRRPAPRLPGRPSRPEAPRAAARARQRGAAAFAACALVAQLVVGAPVLARNPGPTPIGTAAQQAPEPTQLQPGIHYEDALAHAADRIDFTPGGRVTVGFRPRADDAWDVAGRAPRALPAGSASGREMMPGKAPAPPAAKPKPSPTATAPIDAPAVDPSEIPVADGASAVLTPAGDPLAADGTRLRRQVMGFLPYWEVSDAVLDYELLSTIAYFSVGADKNGNLLKLDPDGTPTTGWGGWTSSRMTSIINAAHTKGTRVVLTISVFAWTSGQAALQGALLGNPAARQNLAVQAADAVRARGADGINLDFEPIASGYADEYTLFVRAVRAELNKRAQPGYQLTFDTTGYIGNYPIEAATAPGGADAIFIMGYDYRTAGVGLRGLDRPALGSRLRPPGHGQRLYRPRRAVEADPRGAVVRPRLVDRLGRGQRKDPDRNEVRRVQQRPVRHGRSTTPKQYGRRWDTREQAPGSPISARTASTTYGCVTTWRQVYYDDAESLKRRYDMINRYGPPRRRDLGARV